MGLVITRPMSKDGTSIGGSLASRIIDAKMITENFQVLYESYNAQIHGTNLNVPTNIRGFLEELVQWQELVGDYLTSYGRGHSHNGIDSEVLAPGSINSDVTTLGSFGAWQFPADGATQVMVYGTAEISGSKIPASSGSTVRLVLEVPHDVLKWGYVDQPPRAGSVGYARPFAQFRSSDTRFYNKVQSVGCSFNFNDTPGWLYLDVYLQFFENSIGLEYEPFFVDWVMPMMTFRAY